MTSATELLPCPFCGGEAEIIEADYGMYMTGYAVYCRKCCLKLGVTGRLGETYEWSPVFNTEAEAIAAWNARAELRSEPPYDELLRCLENDWNISASWDGLRKFWCIELTEEGVKLRDAVHGTLTAEQVEKAIHDCSTYASYDGCTYYASGIRLQAIADELNARAERTCNIESSYLNDFTSKHECWYEFEMQCGYRFTWDEMEPPRFCPNCGGEVREKVRDE